QPGHHLVGGRIDVAEGSGGVLRHGGRAGRHGQAHAAARLLPMVEAVAVLGHTELGVRGLMGGGDDPVLQVHRAQRERLEQRIVGHGFLLHRRNDRVSGPTTTGATAPRREVVDNRLLPSSVRLRGYAVNSHRRREVISSESPARTKPASAPSRPESAPSLREHALVVIRHAITTGDLDEETIYSAAGLAKQLGISLSPVREAMMSLVAEGTVEAVPNRGFRLVPVTREDLEEI